MEVVHVRVVRLCHHKHSLMVVKLIRIRSPWETGASTGWKLGVHVILCEQNSAVRYDAV